MTGNKEVEMYAEAWNEDNEAILYGTKDYDPYIQELLAAKFELERSLLNEPFDMAAEIDGQKKKIIGPSNVVGVGIGEKLTAGRATGQLCVRIYVAKKSTSTVKAAGEILIPDGIQGIKTDVVEIGFVKAYAPVTQNAETMNDRLKYPRPAPGGCSLGHLAVSGGTFGCVVHRLHEVFILSTNQVLANTNRGRSGDAIIQPAFADNGSEPDDHIAELAQFVPIRMGGQVNLVDCALAITSLELVRPEILQIGQPEQPTVSPQRGLAVRKRGRSTGLTHGGIIEDINLSVRMDYSDAGWALFRNQMLIRGEGFSAPGDSGALVMAQQSNHAIGLLTGGNTDSGITITNKISDVLEYLNVQIL